mgnify:FL=1
MTREELQNKLGDAICEYCNKNIISEHNIGIGWLCEGQYCEEAQDGYAAENNIELEDWLWYKNRHGRMKSEF